MDFQNWLQLHQKERSSNINIFKTICRFPQSVCWVRTQCFSLSFCFLTTLSKIFLDFWFLCVPKLFLRTDWLLSQSQMLCFPLSFYSLGRNPTCTVSVIQFSHDFHSFTQWQFPSIIICLTPELLQACLCDLNSRLVYPTPTGHFCLKFC